MLINRERMNLYKLTVLFLIPLRLLGNKPIVISVPIILSTLVH